MPSQPRSLLRKSRQMPDPAPAPAPAEIKTLSAYADKVVADVAMLLDEEAASAKSMDKCLSPMFDDFDADFYDIQTGALACLAG